jgi:hypothetical protein
VGGARRKAYAAAIAAHDHATLARLLAAGIPPRWTAQEIGALATASLAPEEKRRRIALLFANPGQLGRALYEGRYELPDSLLTWLPAQDWGPVLRVIERDPDNWRDSAPPAGRPRTRGRSKRAGLRDRPCAGLPVRRWHRA